MSNPTDKRRKRMATFVKANPTLSRFLAVCCYLIMIAYPGFQLWDALSDGQYWSGNRLITRESLPSAFNVHLAKMVFYTSLGLLIPTIIIGAKIKQIRRDR